MYKYGKYIYFNSIKVQLGLREVVCIYLHLRFQFHKGTIRTYLRHDLADCVTHFNSIKVQLELAE